MSASRLFVFSILALLVLGGCSGPSQSGNGQNTGPSPSDPGAARGDAARVSVAQYETFDVTEYSVRPPEQTVEVAHRVPGRLMRGRADEGVKQTVEGFRIQVYSAQDQEASQDFRERVRRWWDEVKADAPQDLFRSPPPIVIEYSQPYYRVRIGAFAERETAAEALEFVRKEYSGAFVARSTVTVVR
ncbi:SPOR domain-containing protein [Salinibacter sp. 10B]|uniref:SPOR domain-containing protein n=1 Tax=Salinibacter sp. 10B TaxID=1923971 RepID=UPI000CF4E276|nr:SPOR domain-containing protein [Salinibacter sp. 10B]PQJ35862.1 SPOR domain-containing protein [Salinibacter sp. 10B]